jgi:membrane fusion protein, macrolide-specific efflux system
MKLRNTLGLSVLAAALLVAASMVWARMGAQDGPSAFNTASVVRGDIEDAVSALGSMQPQEFVDVGTQVSGQLKRLMVKVGDTVKPGAVLAEIDTTLLAAKVEAGQATLQSLAAQMEEKQVQLALAQRQHKRNASMLAQDAISRDAFETSQTNTQVMAAQVSALHAQRQQTAATLKIEQSHLANARIHAPMAGTVVSLNARQGQTLNASQQAPVLMRLARLDTMTVVTQVSEADVVRLAAGTPAYFSTLGRPDRRWQGKVRQVLPRPTRSTTWCSTTSCLMWTTATRNCCRR